MTNPIRNLPYQGGADGFYRWRLYQRVDGSYNEVFDREDSPWQPENEIEEQILKPGGKFIAMSVGLFDEVQGDREALLERRGCVPHGQIELWIWDNQNLPGM